jgi:hypothetical protein
MFSASTHRFDVALLGIRAQWRCCSGFRSGSRSLRLTLTPTFTGLSWAPTYQATGGARVSARRRAP